MGEVANKSCRPFLPPSDGATVERIIVELRPVNPPSRLAAAGSSFFPYAIFLSASLQNRVRF
jgi:hypothetical protein